MIIGVGRHKCIFLDYELEHKQTVGAVNSRVICILELRQCCNLLGCDAVLHVMGVASVMCFFYSEIEAHTHCSKLNASFNKLKTIPDTVGIMSRLTVLDLR